MNKEIEIIHAPTTTEPYIIINKPAKLPSAPLNAEDTENAFSQCAKIFPEILFVHGKKEIEHGLLHRLDTVTSGLLLIASTQEFYDYLSRQQAEGEFVKTYKATCHILKDNCERLEGFPVLPVIDFLEGKIIKIESMFRPFGKGNKEVRPVTEDSNEAALKKVGKKIVYSTEIKIIKIEKDSAEVECKLSAGFRHQIRNHLAWIGLPIVNDPLYNINCLNTEKQIQFSAIGLEFNTPCGRKAFFI